MSRVGGRSLPARKCRSRAELRRTLAGVVPLHRRRRRAGADAAALRRQLPLQQPRVLRLVSRVTFLQVIEAPAPVHFLRATRALTLVDTLCQVSTIVNTLHALSFSVRVNAACTPKQPLFKSGND